MNDYLFNIRTPLQFYVHTTTEYWHKLIFKHPELETRLDDLIETLNNPDEIRKSKREDLIFLFYSESGKYWLCVVTKKVGLEGFLVTAYITDRMKEGETIWRK